MRERMAGGSGSYRVQRESGENESTSSRMRKTKDGEREKEVLRTGS